MTAEERSSLEQRTPSLLLSQSNEQMAPSEIVDSHCSCEGVFLSSLLNKLETMLDQVIRIILCFFCVCFIFFDLLHLG